MQDSFFDKDQCRSESDYQKALEEKNAILRRERGQYRDALLYDSLYSYTFDVDEGYVEEKNRICMDERILKHGEIKGRIFYDDLVENFLSRTNPLFEIGKEMEILGLAALKKSFAQGKKIVEYEFFDEWIQKYQRMTILMTKDEVTGHIMACVIGRDISEQKEAQKALENLQKDVEDTLYNAGTGLWTIDLEEGQLPKMYADRTMRLLLGVEDDTSPEECYNVWFNNIDESEITTVISSLDRMDKNGFDENTYRWNHPKMGKIWVRSGGAPASHYEKKGKCYKGYHLNVTDTVEKDAKTKEALKKAYDSVNEKKAELEKQIQLVEGLIKSYETIYYVDCFSSLFIEIGSTDEVRKIIKGSKDIHEVFMRLANQEVAEQSRENYLRFTNTFTLLKRLEGNNYIAFEYESSITGWCRATWIPTDMEDGIPKHVIFAVQNIDEEKKEQNRLIAISETDGLTGIRNRKSGQEKIDELIANRKPGIFCIFDCDRFKHINDTYGHAVGDKVLTAIAKVMQNSFRDSDITMRLGGDEFAFYISGNCSTSSEIKRRWMERFLKGINEIHIEEMGDTPISVSIGVVEYDGNAKSTFDELYQTADKCLYESKKHKGNYVTYA